jgi:hypothetical protein
LSSSSPQPLHTINYYRSVERHCLSHHIVSFVLYIRNLCLCGRKTETPYSRLVRIVIVHGAFSSVGKSHELFTSCLAAGFVILLLTNSRRKCFVFPPARVHFDLLRDLQEMERQREKRQPECTLSAREIRARMHEWWKEPHYVEHDIIVSSPTRTSSTIYSLCALCWLTHF